MPLRPLTQLWSRYNEKKREVAHHPVSGHASMLSLNRPASSLLLALLSAPFFAPFLLPFFFHSRWMVRMSRGSARGGELKQGAKGGCRYWGALRGISLRTLHCVTSSFIPDFAAGLRGESAKTLRPPPLPLPSSFLHRFRPLCRSTIVHASFSSCSYAAPPLTRFPLETFFFPCENSATNFFIIYIYKYSL